MKKLIAKLWNDERIRFLVVGGTNTLISLCLAFFLRWLMGDVIGWNPKLIFLEKPEISFDIPFLICFIGLLPLAYTLQALVTFRVKWSWKGLLKYPLSTIANFLLQEFFILLFEGWIGLTHWIAYPLACILPLPIIFIITKLLLKGRERSNT